MARRLSNSHFVCTELSQKLGVLLDEIFMSQLGEYSPGRPKGNHFLPSASQPIDVSHLGRYQALSQWHLLVLRPLNVGDGSLT
jgi:hypothetical protein